MHQRKLLKKILSESSMEGLHTHALSAAKRKKKKKENMCRTDKKEKKKKIEKKKGGKDDGYPFFLLSDVST